MSADEDMWAIARELDAAYPEDTRNDAARMARLALKTKRGAETLGGIVDQNCRMILDITGLHDWIDETGDGDWGAVWDNAYELLPRAEKAEAKYAEEVQTSTYWMKRYDELHDAVSALVRDLAIEVDDLNANIPPIGSSRIAHLYRTTGLSDALVRLRALLTTCGHPNHGAGDHDCEPFTGADPYDWGDEAVARTIAEGLGVADVNEVRS